jgi:DNA transformation protein
VNRKDESLKDFVLDQLRGLEEVEARRMFGGFGLYQDETFFGIVHKGKLFFKVDESTVGAYRKRKMKPFRPNAKQTLRLLSGAGGCSKTPTNFASGRAGDRLPNQKK